MRLLREIIDNTENNKLIDFLIEVLKEKPDTNLDIATPYFDIKAYMKIKDFIRDVRRFRLLLGKPPEISITEKTLGEELLKTIREEIESFDLSKENTECVKSFINFLKKDNVEIRLFGKFLHGKAYIFDDLIIVGSSNFTEAGLTREGELNSVSPKSYAEYTRKEWFEKFWLRAEDFKNKLIEELEKSRFGSKEYSPYEVFIKAIYEFQKEDIKSEEEKVKHEIPSKVELTEFQEDVIPRIKSRLKKYGGILLADSVGLGKTWIAKRVIEDFGFYQRKPYLVICPAQLRESLWIKELKGLILAENIISQEELASSNFFEKVKKAIGKNKIGDIKLIVVDESHNLRNPYTNRWENFFKLYENIVKEGGSPYVIFLTATPINNTIWDLYWQIILLVGKRNDAFIKENIGDLFQFFKYIEKVGDYSLLGDLLNEISIRRTRDYIVKNYPNATINGKPIKFPKRILENIGYSLDKTYTGMFKEISNIITNELTMACYQILKYKKKEKLTKDEEWELNRMVALSGILRTIFLKRFESSVYAFKISIKNHMEFLIKLINYLRMGKYISKQDFNKVFGRYIMSMDEELPEFKEEEITKILKDINLEDFEKENLFNDIEKDIAVLKRILEVVDKITPDKDEKLNVVKQYLLKLHEKGQIIVFTYYDDTLNYIFDQINNSKEFKKLKIEKISGGTSTTERERIVNDLLNKKIDILISTDVLSEGMNLQSARIVVNYDLHWNPVRMIQRAGRIDRIGSPYEEIFIYNVFPDKELEELLRLVETLQEKIRRIDETIGLDQKILGEKIHPKVFGIIKKIVKKDVEVFTELENTTFGGGEIFYQPLREFINKKGVEVLEKIPLGIYSGLKKGTIRGIFFYYKYKEDYHFWYLYDLDKGKFIKNKTEIIKYISCSPEEKRVIPDFFDKVYEINKKVIEDIEKTYMEIQQKQKLDQQIGKLARDRSTKFVVKMVREINILLNQYLSEHPEDKETEKELEEIREKLINVSLTKRRTRELRKIWENYKKIKDWRKLMKDLKKFLEDVIIVKSEEKMEPFDKNHLKLVVIDFIS
ncbi:MAG: helicase-related protein [Candidatus Aenigmatarchaeota archaeon]